MRPLVRLKAPVTIIQVTAATLIVTFVLVALKYGKSSGVLAGAEIATEVVSVNAASYQGSLAPGAIAAAFGTNLAARVESAQYLPLPIEIGGTSVRLIDSQNRQHAAPLFFVSPGQINYLIPEQMSRGTGRMIVMINGIQVSEGQVQIVDASPAMFTTSFNGRGLPVALTTFDGSYYNSVINPDGSARPVSPGSVWRPNYLMLFGTGLRHAGNLRIRIGGQEVAPMYSGAQGAFAGLDQINLALPPNLPGGMTDIVITADGRSSNIVQLRIQGEAVSAQAGLAQSDVETIIAQAVGKAQELGRKVTVAVTDKEGNVLGVFRMTGAPATTRIGAFNLLTGAKQKPVDPDGLQDVDVPAAFAAISKAGTASFFSTQGNSFTTRTASFIVQEHFPPGIKFQAAGPLFGVQFSQLPCSDVKLPGLPLGLSGDPGGVPIYKNGIAAGGVGIEGDGFYSIDLDASDLDQAPEEIIAVAATRGFEAPADIRGDQILADGIRLPFVNAAQTGGIAPAFASLPGTVDPLFPVRAAAASLFSPLTLGGVPGRIDPRYFPFKPGTEASASRLTAAEVNLIITQAAQQAYRTRAAIRRPLGSPAEVNIAVVDTNGVVLGLFSTQDAPIFGFDVSVQKARTATFFSNPNAGALLRGAEAGKFVKFADAALADGLRLDGAVAFSDRAGGFLSRPFFPDGIDGTANGPFSKPIDVWSPFNTGLQSALVKTALVNILSGIPAASCTAIPNLPNGIQIFAGSVPLYRNGVLIGGIGVSGDGIDQDDIIASAGSVGFEAPAAIRADQFFVRGVRLPFVKFPRHPNL
ncbi:MAG: heme-binding protein [Acidobacteria bacterium]|nr:heme-binding protein [Acidobacteriota bacterium]